MTATSRKTFEDSIPQWQRYNMPVDAWGNMTAVQVQSGDHVDSGDDVTWNSPITFASYEYASNGGPINSLEYGNGDSEAYSYNLYGQLSSVQHFSGNLLDYVAPLPELMDRKKRDIMERKGDKEDENKRQKQQKESNAAAL